MIMQMLKNDNYELSKNHGNVTLLTYNTYETEAICIYKLNRYYSLLQDGRNIMTPYLKGRWN